MVAELRDRDVGMLLRSNFALERAAPASNPQLLLPPRTPGHLMHYYMLQGAADGVGACTIKVCISHALALHRWCFSVFDLMHAFNQEYNNVDLYRLFAGNCNARESGRARRPAA